MNGYRDNLNTLRNKLTTTKDKIAQLEAIRDSATRYDNENAILDKLRSDKDKVAAYDKAILSLVSRKKEIISAYDIQIQKASSELVTYKRKSEILNNSNCIDINNA